MEAQEIKDKTTYYNDILTKHWLPFFEINLPIKINSNNIITQIPKKDIQKYIIDEDECKDNYNWLPLCHQTEKVENRWYIFYSETNMIVKVYYRNINIHSLKYDSYKLQTYKLQNDIFYNLSSEIIATSTEEFKKKFIKVFRYITRNN